VSSQEIQSEHREAARAALKRGIDTVEATE
jgi:hypothetical protein